MLFKSLLMSLSLLLVMSGCSSGDGDNTQDNDSRVSGNISGLSGDIDLILTTDAQQQQITANGSSYSFPLALEQGQSYEVSVRTQPTGQFCAIDNATGVVSGPIPAANVSCTSLSSARVSVSGTIGLASNTVADSDLNDPLSDFADNSTFSVAQPIDNLATIQGFATAVPTSNFETFTASRSSDRFFNTSDANDFYIVTLQAGQTIQLQVVDYDDFDLDNTFSGDLDLVLYDEKFSIVDSSESVTEFEQIVVPADGEYFVNVTAFSGASKYVLKLNPVVSSTGTALAASKATSKEFVPNQAIVHFQSSDTPFALAANAAISFTHTQPHRATLASFSDTRASAAAASLTEPAMQELAATNQQSYERVMTLRRIKTMQQMPGVKYAEPNYWRHAQRVPNDEFYNLQWHYPAMNLPQTWDITTGTPANGQVIVAVVDTGVVLSHPDLNNNLISGYDFISDNGNSDDGQSGIDNNPDDPGDGGGLGNSSWHGTHVAGTVAAESNNSAGIAGVSWGAKIMPLRALGRLGGSSYDIMQSVRFAAGLDNDSGTVPAQRADILNLSLGGGGSSAIEANLYREVHKLGIIIIAAAGNENTSQLSFPASYDGVISVSALDFNGNRAPYSNFGTAIDISAPGGDTRADVNRDGQPDGILSLLVDDSSGSRQPTLAFYQGTSMAAPHVAGMFALMKAVYPALTSADADSLLQSGALTNDAGSPGRDNTYGFGIADALKAVQTAQALAGGQNPPEPPPSVVASPSSIVAGGAISAPLTISNQGGGNPGVVSVNTDAGWLSVVAQQTDSNGLGSYQVSINRSGLGSGLYIGNISFALDSQAEVIVQVSMSVGDVQTGGDLAELFILLYDPVAESTAFQAQGVADSEGNIVYNFSDIPSGSYVVYAGTDVDNDGFICQAGEGCGTYPRTGEFFTINVNGLPIENIDFITDIVAGFGNLDNLTNDSENSRLPEGIPKLAPLKQPNRPLNGD